MAVTRLKVKSCARNSNGKVNGIEVGDILLQFDNIQLSSASQLTTCIDSNKTDNAKLLLLRGAEELIVSVSNAPLGIKFTEEILQDVIIKTYKGNQEQATLDFQSDVVKMESEGYAPSNQAWNQGSWGCGAFLVALLLCFLIIGIIVFIYMLLVKPDGMLTVTYEAKKREVKQLVSNSDEKICPECAETIKSAAIVCRFCKYQFVD